MKQKRPQGTFPSRPIQVAELESILDRVRAALSPEDHEKLTLAVGTLAFLTRELENRGTSIQRLRRMLFGASTETTRRVLGELPTAVGGEAREVISAGTAGESPAGEKKGSKEPRPGHGRNGAEAYWGAAKVKVDHASITHGCRCPGCEKGKVYRQLEPATLLRVQGMAPLQATAYQLERFRCNLCGEVFTAEAPEGVGPAKYDETATGMIAMFRYGCGFPFNRMEKLEGNLGVPLPAATQWELVARAAGPLTPVHEELVRQAAQGTVLHNDDTTMKILGLKPRELEAIEGEEFGQRTGVFTSGIVSINAGFKVALFFTGRKHAGENLAEVLAHRSRDLPAPIQMCDALSRNAPGEFQTILANCLAHGRRRFTEVAENFPEECRYVLETLRDVYRNDELARREGLSPKARLAVHQEQSAPLMAKLETWFREQFEQHVVEPNSGLGEAISYMQNHWPELTLFLRQPGAPLDNNICERALKKAILHRKNSMFYKTRNGARVGDLFMSLIHTAELCGADPFDYLVTLQRNTGQISRNPAQWMPWNYREAVTKLASAASSPG